jgi:hypothetical protein
MNMNEEPMDGPPFEGPQYEQPEAPVEQAQISAVGRITGVFFSPGETFADINRKPTWLVPLIISIVLASASGYLFQKKVLTDEVLDRMIRQRMEQGLEQQGAALPPEETMQRSIEMGKTFARLSYLFPVPLIPLILVIIAGVFYMFLMLVQAETRFKKVLSVASWSWLVYGLGAILMVITLFLKDPEMIDPMNPESLMATNLAAFLPANEVPKFIRSLAGSFELFGIWYLVLLSIGFSKISRKVSVGKAGGVVFAVWLVYILCKAGLASVFG